MAVLEREELRKKLIEHLSSLDDDSAIELIEDVSDSFDAFGGDDTNEWKKKFEELKKKYVDRFLNKEETSEEEKADEETEVEETEEKEAGEVTEEDIFKVKEEN